MKVVLFDIDGTLLHSNGFSKDAFFSALSETFDVDFNPGNIPWGWLTDKGVAEYGLKQIGIEQELIDEKLPQAFELLGEKWANQASLADLVVYPDATWLVDELSHSADYELAVLTANCQQGAEHKLRLAGLDRYFNFLVAGSDIPQRNDLPEVALEKAQRAFGKSFSGADFIVIGDTPADVSCAKAWGMQAVAVATGRYSVEELEKCSADLVLDSLRPSQALYDLLY